MSREQHRLIVSGKYSGIRGRQARGGGFIKSVCACIARVSQ